MALAPPIAALLFSGIAGPAADALIDRGVEVERVRKISQCIAFLGPSALLTLASFTDSNWLAVGEDGTCLRLSAPFALHVRYAVTPFCCPRVLVRDCRYNGALSWAKPLAAPNNRALSLPLQP